MNSKDLIQSLNYVGEDLVNEAEYGNFRAYSQPAAPARRRFGKPFLIAALIGLMVFLMGCALIMMSLQDLKIGESSVRRGNILDSDGNTVKDSFVAADVISLQGMKGTPAYLANQEWLQFTESYTPERGKYWESDEPYWAYSVLDQVMVDKIDEICERYGLNVIGKPWHEHVDCNQFLPLIGVDNLLKKTSNATLHIPRGRFFAGGSFTVYGTLALSNVESPMYLTYHCVKKDVFYDVFAYMSPEAVTEKNYTTTDDVALLLLESDTSGMIIADRTDCFISVSIDLNRDASLEEIAEQFDYSIQAKPLDHAEASTREQASIDTATSIGREKGYLQRTTYHEYVDDLLWNDRLSDINASSSSEKEYAFFDLDGNGKEELLIFNGDFISNVVGMIDGKTDEGKSYRMILCEDNVLIDQQETVSGTWYHIFRFANDGDPVFSNSKELSIVRLKNENDTWWRTSTTEHYADFDVKITESEALSIINSYVPIDLDSKPLTEFEE